MVLFRSHEKLVHRLHVCTAEGDKVTCDAINWSTNRATSVFLSKHTDRHNFTKMLIFGMSIESQILLLTLHAIFQQSSNARKVSQRETLTLLTEKATRWRNPSQQWTLPTAHSKVWKARATARNPTAGGSSGWHTALVMANSPSRSLTASVTCTQAAATLPAPVPHHNPTAHRLIFHRNSPSAQFSSECEAPIWLLSNCAVPSAKRYVERYFSL